MSTRRFILAMTTVILSGGPCYSESQTASPAKAGSPSSLIILFDVGSSRLRSSAKETLDRASRAYVEGKPIVMVISGSSDRSGNSKSNLKLSQSRANAVLKGLLDRGIPAERFQILAKGETDLPVSTPPGTANKENRRVVITWH